MRGKQVFLSILLLILIAIALKLSLSFYQGMKGLPLPSSQSRQDNAITVHRWMTVNEVAERYGLSVQEVFDLLQIVPESGDKNLTLRELKIKYDKPPEVMQQNVQRILDSARNSEQSP